MGASSGQERTVLFRQVVSLSSLPSIHLEASRYSESAQTTNSLSVLCLFPFSIATAAGGLTGQFVAAVPAMYQLGLLGESPIKDFGRLFTFTLVSAYYGCFFAIPLRKFYILKQHLVFPTPTATAYTIKSLHAKGGEAMAKKKTRALLIAFAGAFVFVVVNQYASGILLDWHFGYWLCECTF